MPTTTGEVGGKITITNGIVGLDPENERKGREKMTGDVEGDERGVENVKLIERPLPAE